MLKRSFKLNSGRNLHCQKCPLKGAKMLCPERAEDSEIMFIGEGLVITKTSRESPSWGGWRVS